MGVFQIIVWIIYPYTVLAIFTMGLVWRCDIGELYKNQLNFSKRKKVTKLMLRSLFVLSICSGIAIIGMSSISNDWIEIYYWVVSLMQLRPNMDLIGAISVLTRTHIILMLTFILALSFTKYIMYIFNPVLICRKISEKSSFVFRTESKAKTAPIK